MKKLFSLLALLSVISIATPKKSEAGVIVVTGGGAVAAGYVLIGLGAIPLALGIKTLVQDNHSSNSDAWPSMDFSTPLGVFGILAGATLIVLDADGNLSQDQLAAAFKKNYSEIDNEQAFDALATLVKAKAAAVPFVDGKKEIPVTSAELNEVFKSVDLKGHEAVFAKMVQDLK